MGLNRDIFNGLKCKKKKLYLIMLQVTKLNNKHRVILLTICNRAHYNTIPQISFLLIKKRYVLLGVVT